ncbi:glycosyltransferase [Flavobacteriaceae bacterium]|nr:glycosyltransferase [Flavobacteriaceae bacterium]
MNSKPVSILLPVYNGEKFIIEAINSIFDNSYQNFEIVLIDDGSTDNTVPLIKKFKDDRIHLFKKSNSGLVESLNYGISKCKNEIIMRMDADDRLHPSKMELQLSSFLKRKVVLIGTEAKVFNEYDSKLSNIYLPAHHKDIIHSMINLKPGLIHGTIMFYKEAIEKVKMYSTKLEHAEDYDLFYRLAKIGELSNLKKQLYYIRKHEQNVSHLNAKLQLTNTFIAREYYFTKEISPISEINYSRINFFLNKEILIKTFTKLHCEIVKEEFLTKKSLINMILFKKILRRFLKWGIINISFKK